LNVFKWNNYLKLDIFFDKITSRRSCLISFQILVFLGYQTRFFLIIMIRQDSFREERKKILTRSSRRKEPCLITQKWKNRARMTRYSRFFKVQTRIFFLSSQKESWLKFKMKRILSEWSRKQESGKNYQDI
jgi:hypothetical protein